MSDSPAYIEFNRKICEVLGLDINRVAGYMIVGNGDQVSISVDWLGPYDRDLDDIQSWVQHFKIVDRDDPTREIGAPPP